MRSRRGAVGAGATPPASARSNDRIFGLLAALACLAAPVGAQSQPESVPDRFEFRIGGQVFSSFTSSVRLDSETRGIGTQINLEADVNLDERLRVGRADGIYNFSARHYVSFSAYDIERTGTRVISRDIRFGDRTFTVSTSVTAAFDENVAKVAYGYNALVRPRGTLGPSFGLHVMELEAGLAVTGVPLAYDARTTAPLPVLGVRGRYRFAERWELRGALEWFDIDFGDIDGLFTDLVLTVEHDTFENFGFGFGLNNNSLDIESGDDSFRGIIDLSFRSVIVYFKGSLGRGRRPGG